MDSHFEPDALACSGSWLGDDSNQLDDALAEAQARFSAFAGSVPWTFVHTIVDPGNIGTLTFEAAIKGYFALSLNGSQSFSGKFEAFSMYLFDGGTDGITTIDYVMLGVSHDEFGKPIDLKYASLLVPVPEPQSYLLMLLGLGLVGSATRCLRRSKQIDTL